MHVDKNEVGDVLSKLFNLFRVTEDVTGKSLKMTEIDVDIFLLIVDENGVLLHTNDREENHGNVLVTTFVNAH